MGLLDSKTECCGSNLKNEQISFLGLLTLSTPIILLLTPIVAIQKLLKTTNSITVIFKSNIVLIKQATILPNLKCSIAALTLGQFPALSAFTFKYFNLCTLVFTFLLILTPFFLVISL
jgi:hypothetical protein